MTSVTLHATSMLEYPALLARKGKLFTMGQTRRIRLETCMTVVLIGARTIPAMILLAGALFHRGFLEGYR